MQLIVIIKTMQKHRNVYIHIIYIYTHIEIYTYYICKLVENNGMDTLLLLFCIYVKCNTPKDEQEYYIMEWD